MPIFCTQCGVAIGEQNSFCTACGTSAPSGAGPKVPGPNAAQSGEIPRKKPSGKTWKPVLILVAVALFVYALGALAWQFLHFAQQFGRAEVEEQVSQVGTCVTEVNGFYHCAQDRISSGGVHIELRQCAAWEIKTPFPVCWSDQPVPLRPSLPQPTAQSNAVVGAASPPSPEAFSPSGRLLEKKLGDYTIRIYSGSSDELAGGFLEILQAGTRVYTGQHESFEIDDTGAPVGADVTGTGNPNLVVKEYSGGAHCCTSFEVFNIGSNFQKLATVESADCDGAHFQRQDSGGYVFYGCDPATRMYGASFADSAAPGVILRYVNGSFHLAPDLMRKAPPSVDELRAKAGELASNRTWSTQDVPGAFWQYVIDLTYSGNSRSADQFVALAWPAQRTDKAERMQEFLAQLRKSPYWEDIQALNAR